VTPVKILLDEQVPEPALQPLQFMLPGHQVDHVQSIRWKGKQDLQLIPDMAKRDYLVLVTADIAQLEDHEECAAIKKAGIHHVRFERHGRGIASTASAIATVVAGVPMVVPLLEGQPQRLVELGVVKCGQTRFKIVDPERDPPTLYWPGRKSVQRRHPPRDTEPS
jgi:hypothetical protein